MDRQHSPTPTGAAQIAHGVDHLPEINLARTAATPRLEHQRRQLLPLLARQIRRIALGLLGDLGHPATYQFLIFETFPSPQCRGVTQHSGRYERPGRRPESIQDSLPERRSQDIATPDPERISSSPSRRTNGKENSAERLKLLRTNSPDDPDETSARRARCGLPTI